MRCSAFPWFSYCPEFWNGNAKPLKDEEFGRRSGVFFLRKLGSHREPNCIPGSQKEGNDFVKEIQVGRLVKYDQFLAVLTGQLSVRAWGEIRSNLHGNILGMYWSVEVDPWLIRFFWYVLVVCRMSAKPFHCLYLEEEGWTVSRCKWPTSVLLPGKWDFAGCVCMYLQLSAALLTIFPYFSIFFSDQLGHLGILVPLALKTKGRSRFFIGIPL